MPSSDNPQENAVRQYSEVRPLFEAYATKIRILLTEILEAAGIRYHLIEVRVKTVESFGSKLSRPNKAYADPLTEIKDLAGARIILYYLDDVDRVAELLQKEFKVDPSHSVDKGQGLKPNELGYISIHQVVTISKKRADLAEWAKYKALPAEIQIRTVLQHAWAAIDHELQYKNATDIPSEVRRRLFRLSALLELADEEFAAIKSQETALSKRVAEEIDSKNLNLPLNAITLSQYLVTSKIAHQYAQKARTLGYTVRPERDEDEEGGSISEAISHANDLGIKTISDLDTFLKSRATMFDDYMLAQLNGSQSGKSSEWIVSGSFITILLLLTATTSVTAEDLRSRGWNKRIAERVLEIAANFRKP